MVSTIFCRKWLYACPTFYQTLIFRKCNSKILIAKYKTLINNPVLNQLLPTCFSVCYLPSKWCLRTANIYYPAVVVVNGKIGRFVFCIVFL